jgi:hypothetical protein
MSSNSDPKAGRSRPAAPLLRRIPRKYVLAALGCLAAFDLLFYVFAVRPLGQREIERQALLATLEKQIEARRQIVERLQLVVSKVEKARGEGDTLLDEITLDRRTAFSALLTELTEAASQSGIDTREANFELEPIEGTEQHGMVSITANFRGHYENLVRLVNRLDRSERFLIIESLAAAPRSETTELQITMRLNTFLRNIEPLRG